MLNYETYFDVMKGIGDFMIDKTEPCPTAISDMLRAVVTAPMMTPVEWEKVLRAIYDADRGEGGVDNVGPQLMEIAAGGFYVMTSNRHNAIGQDGTAPKMRMALLRDAGVEAPEGMAWPDPADDPAKTPEPPSMPLPSANPVLPPPIV